MITINAQIKSRIDWVKYYKEALNSTSKHFKDFTLDDGNTKEEIINALNSCKSFVIEDDCITIKKEFTKEEYKTRNEEDKKGLIYWISRVKKDYQSSVKNKNEITTYLEYKNLNWILEEIKK